MPEVVTKAVVLCEEIREEKSGKLILCGVYPGGISVSEFPATIRLSLYVMLSFSETGSFDLEIKSQAGESQRILGVSVEVNETDQVVSIPTPPFGVKIDSECSLDVFVGLAGEPENKVASFKIDINPEIWVQFPSAPSQPDEQSESDALH